MKSVKNSMNNSGEAQDIDWFCAYFKANLVNETYLVLNDKKI